MSLAIIPSVYVLNLVSSHVILVSKNVVFKSNAESEQIF